VARRSRLKRRQLISNAVPVVVTLANNLLARVISERSPSTASPDLDST
jgi:hypothetical protein